MTNTDNGYLHLYHQYTCADPDSFVRGGPTLTIFLVDKGREDPNTAIRGLSSARQRNAILSDDPTVMASDGPTLNAGLVHVAL